ncbi:MAG: hypothetical protein AAF219_08355 [Myxococcota bacterium]
MGWLQNPADWRRAVCGKSTLANRLFRSFGATVIHGDHLVNGMRRHLLGYAEADLQQRCEEIRRFAKSGHCWSTEMSDKQLLETIEEFRDRSRWLREQCTLYSISYFDVSRDFVAAHDAAYAHGAAWLRRRWPQTQAGALV